jgi:hypothetical protein
MQLLPSSKKSGFAISCVGVKSDESMLDKGDPDEPPEVLREPGLSKSNGFRGYSCPTDFVVLNRFEPARTR